MVSLRGYSSSKSSKKNSAAASKNSNHTQSGPLNPSGAINNMPTSSSSSLGSSSSSSSSSGVPNPQQLPDPVPIARDHLQEAFVAAGDSPETSQTTTQPITSSAHNGESKLIIGKSSMSSRSVLVVMLTATLCLLVYKYPADFKETFAAAVGTAIGFYFAQNNNKQK